MSDDDLVLCLRELPLLEELMMFERAGSPPSFMTKMLDQMTHGTPDFPMLVPALKELVVQAQLQDDQRIIDMLRSRLGRSDDDNNGYCAAPLFEYVELQFTRRVAAATIAGIDALRDKGVDFQVFVLGEVRICTF
jgi:hypothetical protein